MILTLELYILELADVQKALASRAAFSCAVS